MKNYHMSVQGAQLTLPERKFIFALAAEAELAVGYEGTIAMVNIGVQWGASLWCIREGAPNSFLIGVDIDLRHNRSDPNERIHHEKEFTNIALIEAESAAYGHIWQRPISLLLIDGDHHYSQVRADIASWVPHVVTKGVAVFHDYSPTDLNMSQFPELEGVKRAVDEYFNGKGEWERMVGPDSIVAFKKVG